jgi:hypothetical protein
MQTAMKNAVTDSANFTGGSHCPEQDAPKKTTKLK